LTKATFTIDAALLHELGERLIGQSHIALAELIKNSYDADGYTCRITFKDDGIEIVDDGHGMTVSEFLSHWMRIGTTHKVDQKTSRNLGRRLTGSKGIGRLAVQFLAKEMLLETTAKGGHETLSAFIDWETAEKGTELTSVEVEYQTHPGSGSYGSGSPHGLRIVLTGLRHQWSADDFRELGKVVWLLRSPFRSKSSKEEATASDFDIELEAPEIAEARKAFDSLMVEVLSDWKSRIIGVVKGGRGQPSAKISVSFKEGYGAAEAEVFREKVHLPIRPHDRPQDGVTKPLLDDVRFEIRIYKLEGRQGSGAAVDNVRVYFREFGSVSIYDNGFRLPYYGAEHDWLDLATDQQRRLSISALLPEHLKIDERYMLDLPAMSRVFGAVEVSTQHEAEVAKATDGSTNEWLQIQASRDRLHDNNAFSQLKTLVRWSLDFYANRYRARLSRERERRRSTEPPSAKQERALVSLERNRDAIPAPVYREIKREVSDALKASKSEEAAEDARAVLLAPLATGGMAAVALNHELSREAEGMEQFVRELYELARKHRIPRLKEIADEIDAANQRQSALRSLFSPLVDKENRDASYRLKVRAVTDEVRSALGILMPQVTWDMSDLPADLLFPAGAYVEWYALLQNIFTNAWNAMLTTKRREIRISAAGGSRSRAAVNISDTGVGLGVPLSESAVLFRPFERRLEIPKDKQSLALGGQGMGLAIVQMIAQKRKMNAAFIEAESGFATTLQLSWRN
jgi:signal transduction histidine kinase